jgi:2-keto-4-pentenoate hydratase/2-oxohepta-3-ene-1,7-dioic acid hydratase in catechol pathway
MTDPFFRLGSFSVNGDVKLCLVLGDADIVELKSAATRAGQRSLAEANRLDELLSDWDRNFDRLRKVAEAVAREGAASVDPLRLKNLRPLPPVTHPLRLLYAAANYADHVAGMTKTFTNALPAAGATSAPLRPYLFAKACAMTGAFDDIVLPVGMIRIDWEAELAVVIGRRAKHVPPEKVGDHIAGYMTTNDVSCRDRTWREDRPAIRSDWLSGKSFDSFAPMGPYFTPRAFVPAHDNLWVRLWVNGVLKQDGVTRDMIFGIEDQLAYAAAMMTLEPGDIFSTGTPAGTGQERLEFLKAGDVVEAEVELCGRQRNHVVAGDPKYRA